MVVLGVDSVVLIGYCVVVGCSGCFGSVAVVVLASVLVVPSLLVWMPPCEFVGLGGGY